MESDLFLRLKADPTLIDKVLYPGKYLYEATAESLEISVMPSGFPTLDQQYMFLKNEGELIVVAGEPSMGKSALMLQIALNVSQHHNVHIFSLEDSFESIVRRRVAAELDVSISLIQMGGCRDRVPKALDRLKDYKYFIDDTGGLTVDEICDRARTRYKKHKTKLIAIDHLQIIGMDVGHSRALEVGKATSKLKCLAKELRCPILLASQLNRQYSSREDRKPRLSDLKESSSIEADADIVLSVYREYRYTKLRPFDADIGILKNRNGQVGECVFKFTPSQALFQDIKNDTI